MELKGTHNIIMLMKDDDNNNDDVEPASDEREVRYNKSERGTSSNDSKHRNGLQYDRRMNKLLLLLFFFEKE